MSTIFKIYNSYKPLDREHKTFKGKANFLFIISIGMSIRCL